MCIAQLEYYYINTYINIPKLLLETDIWTLNYMYIAEVCCIREAMGNMFPMLICLDRGDIGCQQIKIGNFHSSLSPPPTCQSVQLGTFLPHFSVYGKPPKIQ